MITIHFNGQLQHLPQPISLKQLLDQSEVQTRFCALELNGQLVPREQWASTLLAEGDRLEVVTLVGGG